MEFIEIVDVVINTTACVLGKFSGSTWRIRRMSPPRYFHFLFQSSQSCRQYSDPWGKAQLQLDWWFDHFRQKLRNFCRHHERGSEKSCLYSPGRIVSTASSPTQLLARQSWIISIYFFQLNWLSTSGKLLERNWKVSANISIFNIKLCANHEKLSIFVN